MASKKATKTTVVELTRFGFKDDKGLYVGYSPKMPEKDKALFVPGRTLEVEMYVADSGKQYVNKVMEVSKEQQSLPKNVTENVTKSPRHIENKAEVMTRADWVAKDIRISRQGAIQAAYKVAATIVPAAKLKEVAYRIADEMLEFINGK